MNSEYHNKMIDALVADGYDRDLAEALAKRGENVESVQNLCKREVLNHFLCWNGIIGYTDAILRVLDNIERQVHY